MRLAASGNVGRTGAGFPRAWHLLPFFGNPLDATANAAAKAASHRRPRCWSLAGTLSGVCKQVIRRTCDGIPSQIAGKWIALWWLRCLTRGVRSGTKVCSLLHTTNTPWLGRPDPIKAALPEPVPEPDQTQAAELRPCRRPSNNNKRGASLLHTVYSSTRAGSTNGGHSRRLERGWMLRFGAE
jgi:hypothetical protein